MSPSTIRNTIISALALVAAVLVFGFMVYQTDAQGKKLTQQIETLESQRSQEESYFRLQKTTAETKAERAQLESYFLLNESDSIDFLNTVESLAPQAGVVLRTSNLTLVTDEADDSQWVEVNFSFSGSRARVRDFIRVLEAVPYQSRLMSVDLSAAGQSQWNTNVTMRVAVLSYDS